MESALRLRFLLDTHVWIWSLLDPDRLGKRVASELADIDNELWLSPISIWETHLLIERGRLTVDLEPERWLARAGSELPARDAPLTRDVARTSRTISLAHQDPADRFIAATAEVYDLTLVTADEQLLDLSEIDVLSAR